MTNTNIIVFNYLNQFYLNFTKIKMQDRQKYIMKCMRMLYYFYLEKITIKIETITQLNDNKLTKFKGDCPRFYFYKLVKCARYKKGNKKPLVEQKRYYTV